MTAARLGPLSALPAAVEVADGLDEHVPFVDDLEHAKDAQPGDPSSDTDDGDEEDDDEDVA